MTNSTCTTSPEGQRRICELAEDLAKQEGIRLTSVLVDDGQPIVTSDYHLLTLISGEYAVSEKFHHEEMMGRNKWNENGLTEAKIKSAVERLRLLLDR